MANSTYYVTAAISEDGNFANCLYFLDIAGLQPYTGSRLEIATDAGGCRIAQTNQDSDLVLVGASYKTLGQPPSMNMSNFSAADDERSISVPMPTDQTVIKGVVLLFANKGTVDGLYPSSDPEVINGFGMDK